MAATTFARGHAVGHCLPSLASSSAAPRMVLPAGRRSMPCRTVQQATVVSTAEFKVMHVDATTYHTFLADNAERLVVVDVYTDWCGPCKIIAPEIDKMAVEYPEVVFAKLNAGQDDETKRLAISLGIKALPTFHLYRNSKKQDEMTGAKIANLRALVTKHK